MSELRPWHYADPFFQETPPDGAVDLDPLFDGQDVVALVAAHVRRASGSRSTGSSRAATSTRATGKNQHAFCIDIDRGGDVRILANTVETHDCADTMLHELGHGVYDLGFRDDLPWLLRSTHLVATEASALLFGALAGRPRVARARPRRERVPRSPSSADGSRRRAPPSCSSSRAGCSS